MLDEWSSPTGLRDGHARLFRRRQDSTYVGGFSNKETQQLIYVESCPIRKR